MGPGKPHSIARSLRTDRPRNFHGSDDFLSFVDAWCVDGLKPEDMTVGHLLLWCNPRKRENQLSWHRDVTWWGTGESYA